MTHSSPYFRCLSATARPSAPSRASGTVGGSYRGAGRGEIAATTGRKSRHQVDAARLPPRQVRLTGEIAAPSSASATCGSAATISGAGQQGASDQRLTNSGLGDILPLALQVVALLVEMLGLRLDVLFQLGHPLTRACSMTRVSRASDASRSQPVARDRDSGVA